MNYNLNMDVDYFKQMGKKGGDARAKKLSKKRKIEIARDGGKAKWAKAKKP